MQSLVKECEACRLSPYHFHMTSLIYVTTSTAGRALCTYVVVYVTILKSYHCSNTYALPFKRIGSICIHGHAGKLL